MKKYIIFFHIKIRQMVQNMLYVCSAFFTQIEQDIKVKEELKLNVRLHFKIRTGN